MILINVRQLISCTGGCRPVHPRDGTSEHTGACQTPDPAVDPSLFEVEEERQGCDGCNTSDGCRSDDISSRVGEFVVADTEIADVVHARDGKPRNCASKHKRGPKEALARLSQFYSREAEEQENDRQKHGQCREARVVIQLNAQLAISHGDRSVTDKVHAPDGNKAKRH